MSSSLKVSKIKQFVNGEWRYFLLDGNLLKAGIPTEPDDVVNKEYLDMRLSNVSNYLGTVETENDLYYLAQEGKTIKAGDYCRASSDFVLSNNIIAPVSYEDIHIGDLIIAKNNSIEGIDFNPDATNWDIIHTEEPYIFATEVDINEMFN